jgi:hypothetical protein
LRGIELGHPIDLVLDPDGRRALGLVVMCKDDEQRFLPLTIAEIGEDEIVVRSAFSLLALDELDFYRTHARTIRLSRGAAVRRGGQDVGKLEDVIVSRDGSIAELVVANGDGRQLLARDDTVSIA